MSGLDFIVLKNELPRCRENLLRHLRSDDVQSDVANCSTFDLEFNKYLVERYGSRGDEISQAVVEAVNNFAEHANKRDPTKYVNVQAFELGQILYVTIATEEGGFDPNIMRRKRFGMQKRGGGAALMEEFADGIVYHENGKSAYLGFDTTISKIN